ncbi:hypothetical protein GCM10027359_02420 [Marilutibacter aestuarii]
MPGPPVPGPGAGSGGTPCNLWISGYASAARTRLRPRIAPEPLLTHDPWIGNVASATLGVT